MCSNCSDIGIITYRHLLIRSTLNKYELFKAHKDIQAPNNFMAHITTPVLFECWIALLGFSLIWVGSRLDDAMMRLCGPEPSITIIHPHIMSHWTSEYTKLCCFHCQPSSLSSSPQTLVAVSLSRSNKIFWDSQDKQQHISSQQSYPQIHLLQVLFLPWQDIITN